MPKRNRGPAPPVRSAAGWTLTEMLMVVAIMGILGALALPAYQQQQRKVGRGDARAALQQLQFDQARYRGSHEGFASSLELLGRSSALSPQGLYRLTLSDVSADGYVAEAIAVGAQAADTDCSTMRMAWRDAATVIYSSGTRLDSDPAACWR